MAGHRCHNSPEMQLQKLDTLQKSMTTSLYIMDNNNNNNYNNNNGNL